MSLATPLDPDRSIANNHEDLSAFLRRVVADACSRRARANAERLRACAAEDIGPLGDSSPSLA